MAGALAWTIQLVLFVLVVQQVIVWIEHWLLRYRAVSNGRRDDRAAYSLHWCDQGIRPA